VPFFIKKKKNITHYEAPHYVIFSIFQFSWATGWTIGVLGFDFCRGLGILLFTTASRTALGPTQPPIQWIPGIPSLGPRREADHSPPSSAEVKNVWSYTSTPHYVFMAWCLVKHFNLNLYLACSYKTSGTITELHLRFQTVNGLMGSRLPLNTNLSHFYARPVQTPITKLKLMSAGVAGLRMQSSTTAFLTYPLDGWGWSASQVQKG
jgi:hypothetical protein